MLQRFIQTRRRYEDRLPYFGPGQEPGETAPEQRAIGGQRSGEGLAPLIGQASAQPAAPVTQDLDWKQGGAEDEKLSRPDGCAHVTSRATALLPGESQRISAVQASSAEDSRMGAPPSSNFGLVQLNAVTRKMRGGSFHRSDRPGVSPRRAE